MLKPNEIIKEYQETLRDLGYDVLYIGAFGSFNYGLEHDKSDLDAKVIVLPKLYQILTKEKVIDKVHTPDGNIEVYGLYEYYQIILNGNFNFQEALLSPYCYEDERFSEFKSLMLEIPTNADSIVGAINTSYERYLKHKDAKGFKANNQLKRLAQLLIVSSEEPPVYIQYKERRLFGTRSMNSMINPLITRYFENDEPEKINKFAYELKEKHGYNKTYLKFKESILDFKEKFIIKYKDFFKSQIIKTEIFLIDEIDEQV